MPPITLILLRRPAAVTFAYTTLPTGDVLLLCILVSVWETYLAYWDSTPTLFPIPKDPMVNYHDPAVVEADFRERDFLPRLAFLIDITFTGALEKFVFAAQGIYM
jgi:hypothetical protein